MSMEKKKRQSENVLILNGVIYRELRSLYKEVIQDGPDAGKEEQVLVHTRSIDDKTYTVRKSGSDLEKIEEVMEDNKMSSLDVATFQEVWTKNSSRRIVQKEYKKEYGGFCSIV